MRTNEIKKALISVTDKARIVDFVKWLRTFEVEILSTGGTAKELRKAGITVTEVSDYTSFPEMMNGRLKTLHPKIHGGLLAERDNPEHMKVCAEHEIGMIDMVVVNLYRFENTVAEESCTLKKAIENIDIGGPAMLRAAAKNYRFVSVVTDPADYLRIILEINERNGRISEATNFELAKKVFRLTSGYDKAISEYLEKAEVNF
jgi:phosphoribosylaminoimidazolecarboxamide formyltransferase / IMP cyclohydrolase